MKKLNALRWCALLTLSALILVGVASLPHTNSQTSALASAKASEIKSNISHSPPPVKTRMLGASLFSFAILTAIIIIAREIKLSKPQKEQILSKYYK